MDCNQFTCITALCDDGTIWEYDHFRQNGPINPRTGEPMEPEGWVSIAGVPQDEAQIAERDSPQEKEDE